MRPFTGASWWLLGAALLGLATWTGSSEAASGNADGTYTVTITKVEMSTDGTNFVTVFSGSSSINIASVSAGAQAAALASGASLPPGSYTTVRVTLGSTMQIKGYINISGSTWYTIGGLDSNGFSSVAGTDQQNSQSNYAISTFTIPTTNRINSQSVSFTVKEGGAASTVSVAFDTSGVVMNNGGSPTIGAPTVTMTSS